MENMVGCMCDVPSFMIMMNSDGGSAPSQAEITQLCQSSSCSSIVGLSGVSCAGITPTPTVVAAPTTVTAVATVSGVVNDYADMSAGSLYDSAKVRV